MRRYTLLRAKINFLVCSLASLFLICGATSSVYATCDSSQQSCSTNYGVGETQFGAASQHACSVGSFCADLTLGEVTNGNPAGTSYQAHAGGGHVTDRTPYLEVLVNDALCPGYSAGGPSFDLGVLNSSSAKTGNANFSVKSYLADGYIVQTSSPGPTYPGGTPHTLTAMSGGTSSPGTEQFGINLTANTSPTTFGSGPTQLPDTTFGFGQVDNNYNTADHYRYNNGDRIAYSNTSSGTTCYEESLVFNISNLTPAGTYIFSQSIVVTSTF